MGRTIWRDKNSPSKNIYSYTTLLILGLGIFFRIMDAEHESLWVDEGYTYAVSQIPFARLLIPFDVHPPLFYMIENICKDWGESEIALRAPSILAGILTLIILVTSISQKCGWKGALCASLYLSFSYTHMAYGANARNYMFLLFFFTGAAIALGNFYKRIVEQKVQLSQENNSDIIIYIIFALLALYIHNIAFVYLFALNTAVLCFALRQIKRIPKSSIIIFCGANTLIFLLWIPWLVNIQKTASDFTWLSKPDFIEALRQALVLVGPNDTPLPLALTMLAVIAVSIIYALLKAENSIRITIISTVFLIPILIYAISFFKPVYMERTILPVLIGITFSLGFCASQIKNRYILIGLFLIILTSQALSSYRYLTRPLDQDHVSGRISQDWRTAIRGSKASEAFILDAFSLPTADFYKKDDQALFVINEHDFESTTLEEWTDYFTMPASQRSSPNHETLADYVREKNKEGTKKTIFNFRNITFIDTKIFSNEARTQSILKMLKEAGYMIIQTEKPAGLDVYRLTNVKE